MEKGSQDIVDVVSSPNSLNERFAANVSPVRPVCLTSCDNLTDPL